MNKYQEPTVSANERNEKSMFTYLAGIGLVLFVLFMIKGDFFAVGYAVTSGHLNKGLAINQAYTDSSGHGKHSDGLMMQGGKMMVVKSGKTTSMDSDMTLGNGTKVTTDGTMVKKDGTKIMLKEGQHIDMSGNMVPMKKSSGSKGKSNGQSPDSIPRKNY